MAEIATAAGRMAEILTVSPDAQASVAGETVLAGSAMDTRAWKSVAYTLRNVGNTVTYNVYGANAADYTDEVVVSGPTDILNGANSSYAVAQAPYAYYRVKILDKVAPNHGTVTLRGVCKN